MTNDGGYSEANQLPSLSLSHTHTHTYTRARKHTHREKDTHARAHTHTNTHTQRDTQSTVWLTISDIPATLVMSKPT